MKADFLDLDRIIVTGSKGLGIQFYKGLLQVPVAHTICKVSYLVAKRPRQQSMEINDNGMFDGSRRDVPNSLQCRLC